MEQEWLLCDLHLHSENSKITKVGDRKRVKQMSAKDFVEELHEKKVKVFSITDHNYFSKTYYDEIEAYIASKKMEMKIINGVEFDTYLPLSETQFDCIHICIYFEDKVDREELQKCVSSLYCGENGEQLKPQLYEIVNALFTLKCKFIVVPHGDKSRGLFKILRNLPHAENENYNKYAMYKIFNAYDVKPNFFEASESFWAKNFYEKTRKFNEIIDGKSESEYSMMQEHLTQRIRDKSFNLTPEEDILYSYIMEYGAYFAYFSFSDWHNAEPYAPEINNFIFGRLDLAFESFEMATLDPISRIELSKDETIEIPSTLLRTLKFKIGEDEQVVNFSPGLNAVVGKRGSGKSLLLAVLKNLEKINDLEGAKEKYKLLSVSDIVGENRGKIKISEGGLNSIVFLTQESIKSVFEDPDNAQKEILSNFKDIQTIDLSEIEKIVELGEKIVPFDKNYKNLTSNILSLKKSDTYNYINMKELSNIKIKTDFANVIENLEKLEKDIFELKLDNSIITKKIEEFNKMRRYYLKLIDEYNDIISSLNGEISTINDKKTSNQVSDKQNRNDINEALRLIAANFDIILNIEKIKTILNNFSIDDLPVEVYQKGKYLFVTYYEIKDDVKDLIEEKILDSLKGSPKEINDLYQYVNEEGKIKLKATQKNIVAGLKKFLVSETFNSKKEFFEIKNFEIDYYKVITNYEALKKQEEKKNLISLTNASPGMRSVAYLDMLFNLDGSILVLDQPEDNIDNDYISNYLVPNIKKQKKIKQLIFVTHNPSVAVYGDAFNYIYVENKDKIQYQNFFIEKKDDKERLIKILEGGRTSFSNRNKKFGDILGEEEYGSN